MPSFSIPLSGLTASSQALSVIANNLANLNTTGFKDQRVDFRDLFYQNLGTSGAGNPMQVGAGTTIGAISSNFSNGNTENTGVMSDVAIQGNGFFVVSQNQDGTGQAFTRAGNFTVSGGYLITQDGQYVQGYATPNPADPTTATLSSIQMPTDLASFSVASDGTVSGVKNDGTTVVIGQITLANVANQQGLVRQGNNSYVRSLTSGTTTTGVPGSSGLGTLQGGAIESSNVDMAQEFTKMIMTQRGYEASARVISTFDQVTQATINLKQG